MTSLTELGVKSIRDGVAGGTFTAREVAEAFNAAVAEAERIAEAAVEAAKVVARTGERNRLALIEADRIRGL